MKPAQLLIEWENLGGQIQAFSFVKNQIDSGASIQNLLEEIAGKMRGLQERKEEIEDELEPHLYKLVVEVGLADAPPEMKYQWESYAGDRNVAELIRQLTNLKESGTQLHEFLNWVRPPQDDG